MRWTAARSCFAAVVVLAGLSGCQGEKPKGFSITLDDPVVTLGQGSRDSVIVTVTRNNLNQPVRLSVVGTLPPGVTTSFSQNPVQPDVSTIRVRFIATGQAAPTTATVTLRGTSDGVPDREQDIDLNVTLTGSYTLGVLPGAVTVAQGGGGDAIVALNRSGGNASNVSLELTGAPSGLVATVQSPISDRGASLVITADGSVAPGTYPLTITSTAQGFTPPTQSTQLSVVVIPAPSTASLTVPFCQASIPTWFAFRNEGGAWQRVQPTGNAFTFNASQKVTIAFAFEFQGAVELDVFYATRNGLAGQSDRDCDGTKTLTGNVIGLTTGQAAVVIMGANGVSTTSGSYTLQGVANRPLDIVATRGTLTGGVLTPNRMIVRRLQDLTGTIPDLDFGAAESFAPVTSNLTVSGISSGFGVDFRNDLWSANSTHGTFHTDSAPTGAAQLFSVPAGQMAAGDVHELVVEGYQRNGLSGQLQIAYYAASGDRAEVLGAPLSTSSYTAPATVPYTRTRAQMGSQADYPAAAQFIVQQVIGTTARFLNLVGTAPHYGATPATWDIVVPDLSTVPGFNPAWTLQAGQATQWQAIAYSGRDDLLFGALPVAGESYRLAYQLSATPTLLLRSPSTFASRRAPLLRQYLRR